MQNDTPYSEMFYQALRIRLVEEEIIEQYPSDKIQSPVHLSIGQEAVAVALCRAMTKQDKLFSTYRSHAFYLAKGGNLNAMMSELYGKKTGCCGGKGGSMHLSAPEVGFMGTSAVVASSISNAVGSAFASKFQKSNAIDVVAFGDGATEEGVYHESLNFAALHQLPIVFLCENNGLAIHSSQRERQSYSISEHVKSYGIPYLYIEEGYDFTRVYEHLHTVVNHVRKEGSPFFVEIKTERYKEHVGPGEDFGFGYRNDSDILEWKKNCPLEKDKNLVRKFSDDILAEVLESRRFAEESPFPELSELYKDVV